MVRQAGCAATLWVQLGRENSAPDKRAASAFSARWPTHLPLGEKVDMEVRDGLAGVRTVVNHDPKSVSQSELFGHNSSCDQEVTEDGFVRRAGFSQSRYQFFRYNEEMDRSLRLDVVQDDALVVLVFDPSGDFAVDDPLKNGFHREGASGGKRVASPAIPDNPLTGDEGDGRHGVSPSRILMLATSTERSAADWSWVQLARPRGPE